MSVMDKTGTLVGDLRYFRLFPRGKHPYPKLSRQERADKVREYNNFRHKMTSSCYHWYVLTYLDGKRELAYLKVHFGLFYYETRNGCLRRGLFFSRMWGLEDYMKLKDIRLAF